jgi:hypothetical protein
MATSIWVRNPAALPLASVASKQPAQDGGQEQANHDSGGLGSVWYIGKLTGNGAGDGVERVIHGWVLDGRTSDLEARCWQAGQAILVAL